MDTSSMKVLDDIGFLIATRYVYFTIRFYSTCCYKEMNLRIFLSTGVPLDLKLYFRYFIYLRMLYTYYLDRQNRRVSLYNRLRLIFILLHKFYTTSA